MILLADTSSIILSNYHCNEYNCPSKLPKNDSTLKNKEVQISNHIFLMQPQSYPRGESSFRAAADADDAFHMI